MRQVFGAVAVVAGLAAAGATAQEAVTFKDYAHKAGDKTRSTKTEETTTATSFVVMGQVQKKNEKTKKTLVYTTEVLAVGADATKPARLRRAYETAIEDKDGAAAPLPLDGKTVVIEKRGEKYAFALADGTALTGKAAADLEQEFNKKGNIGDNLFPAAPIKAGDSWDLTEKFLKELDDPDSPFVIAPGKAKVTGNLASTTKKGGATFGDLVVTADLPLIELRGKLPIKLNAGSGWKINIKGTGCLDGTSPEGSSSGVMVIGVDGAVMGATLKVSTEIKLSGRTERVTGRK